MSYIGRDIRTGAFRQLDDISSGFDGSDTTHTMQVNSTNVSVGDVNQILLSLGGVIQKPGTDFTVSGSTLTFTTAPASGLSFFAILLGSDNGGTVTPTDGSVTTDKFASGVAIGATGTANTLAGIPFYRADNSIYTHDVSGTDSTAEQNTAYGIGALDAVTTGDKNTAIGYNAGTALTEGTGYNVFVGWTAGSANTTGDFNTVLGAAALIAATTSDNNIAIGPNAIQTSDTEAHNLAIGRDALNVVNSGGEYNVAIGNYSLDALTSADYCTAVGYNAGTAVTTGAANVFMGYEAGNGVTTGGYNIGIGMQTINQADTETNNIAIGYSALSGAVAGGEYNVAIGNYSLDALTSGDHNVVIGDNAGTDMTTAGQNVLVGSYAGTNLTTGATQRVHLIGYAAGFYMTSESYNIGIGNSSLAGANINGAEYNVAIGAFTGDALTTGDYNVLIGYNTGDSMTSGQKNVCVGVNAGSGVTTADNCTLIGNNAGFDAMRSTTTGDGDLVVGNNSTANAFVKVSFNVGSDMRDKTDIEDLPSAAGLNFINQIRPVTYVWDNRDNYYPHAHEKYGWRDHSKKSTKVHTGFVAQEIKELEKSIGWEDDHIVDTSDEKSFTLKYDRFVPSLVKAVQELSAEVEELKTKLKET